MAHPGKRSNQVRKVAKRQAAQQARPAARRAARKAERRVSDIDPTRGTADRAPIDAQHGGKDRRADFMNRLEWGGRAVSMARLGAAVILVVAVLHETLGLGI